MGRGKLKEETVKERALAKAAAFLGVKPDEIVAPVIIETEETRMLEAQSVAIYFEVRGKGFRHARCETCKQTFAYAYHIAGVKCCSVRCMAKKLEKMGLKWDPKREPERRWGIYAPAIVPASALKILQQVLDETPEDLPDNTDL